MSSYTVDISRGKILSLYRRLIRESKKLPTHNRRKYVETRTKREFREKINEVDIKKIEEDVLFAEDMLDNLIIIGDHQRKIIAWEPDPPGTIGGLTSPPKGYFDEIIFEETPEKKGGCFEEESICTEYNEDNKDKPEF